MNIKTNYIRKLRWLLIAILCLALWGLIRSIIIGHYELLAPWLCVVITSASGLVQQKTIRIQRELIEYYEEEYP
jgi:hypothetical protein